MLRPWAKATATPLMLSPAHSRCLRSLPVSGLTRAATDQLLSLHFGPASMRALSVSLPGPRLTVSPPQIFYGMFFWTTICGPDPPPWGISR